MSSLQPDDDTLRKWIDPDTGKLKFPRFDDHNLEERTVAGADLFGIRYYKTMTEASKALRVPYHRLRSRIQGRHSVQANGGQNRALSLEEEAEVLTWAHRQITQGHHIKSRALVQHANEIFAAQGDCQRDKQASPRWARRFIQRNAHIFKRTATHSRDAKRRAGANEMSSLQSDDDTLRKWIDSDTGKLKFQRFHDHNLEERTVAGADLFGIRYYKTMTEASKALRVPYHRLRSRIQGCHSVQANGGQNKALSPEEEAEVFTWAHRQITQGHNIQSRALVQHVNEIFAARGDCQPDKQASKRWARRFIQRNAHIFKRTATHSRDAKRKAGANRASVTSIDISATG
ncbi:hypothetical protein E4U51_005154 [Claviceps purpurea]|nr:hypothetical protein E4U51_005154 [Claviceps purpurea]